MRFAGFGSEEDEWVDIATAVRQRSLPCETTECVAVIPGDLILCFQVCLKDLSQNLRNLLLLSLVKNPCTAHTFRLL